MEDVSSETCFFFIKKYKKNELQKHCLVHQSDKIITMIKKMRLIVMMMLIMWVTTVIMMMIIKPYSI